MGNLKNLVNQAKSLEEAFVQHLGCTRQPKIESIRLGIQRNNVASNKLQPFIISSTLSKTLIFTVKLETAKYVSTL